MGRDYSSRSNKNRSQVETGSGLPGWLWMLIGLALGFMIAVGAWITLRPVDRDDGSAANVEPSVAQPADKALPPKEKPRFSFYEMLPNFEVLIPGRKTDDEAARAETPGDYVIQVGSFRDPAEADKLRASIALLGIESRVETVTIDNRQTWYRVRIGPESDVSRVNEILARLRENGIQPLLMRAQG